MKTNEKIIILLKPTFSSLLPVDAHVIRCPNALCAHRNTLRVFGLFCLFLLLFWVVFFVCLWCFFFVVLGFCCWLFVFLQLHVHMLELMFVRGLVLQHINGISLDFSTVKLKSNRAEKLP